MRTMSHSIKVLAVAVLVWPFGLPGVGAQTKIDARVAQKVKAGYLAHIARFTTWPKSAFKDTKTSKAPLVVGVIGPDPHGVAKAFQTTKLKIQGRTVVLRRLNFVPAPKGKPPNPANVVARNNFRTQLQSCHVLFVTGTKQGNWPALRALIAGRPIITVGEPAGFANSGGMIEFVLNHRTGKYDMHINLDAVKQADLKISSDLLRLKDRVKIVKKAK